MTEIDASTEPLQLRVAVLRPGKEPLFEDHITITDAQHLQVPGPLWNKAWELIKLRAEEKL